MEEYPTEEELKVFERWYPENYLKDKPSIRELVDDIESLWHWTDLGFHIKKGKDSLSHKVVMRLYLDTLGWSGNEEIIGVLQNTAFWILFWKKSERGGHYTFEIPLEAWK